MRLIACLIVCLAAPALAQDTPASQAAPEPELVIFDFEVIERRPHATDAYTQGLFFDDGVLFESTGQVGSSSLRRVDLESGDVEIKRDIPAPYFGEGSTAIGDRIYMVTWRLGAGFIFDRETMEQVGEFDIAGEGWGLTTDGEQLIMSDGTSEIFFLDPETFEETRRITVTFQGRPVPEINELEWVDGQIWANVYGSPEILRIDPQTGYLTGAANLAELWYEVETPLEFDYVPNGVAWEGEDPLVLHVTGKLWPTLFEIRMVPREG